MEKMIDDHKMSVQEMISKTKKTERQMMKTHGLTPADISARAKDMISHIHCSDVFDLDEDQMKALQIELSANAQLISQPT